MPARIACAVLRDDPPQVYAAQDQETLNWVLALHVVAATSPDSLLEGTVEDLRSALREERWGDAVAMWIDVMGMEIDVYPSMDLFTEADVELAPMELQFRPLFRA